MLASIARVIANISPIVVVVIFSKFTSVEQLGELNYFIALITILGVFSDFGIPEAIQTFLPKQKGDKQVTAYLIMELALVCITAVGLYLADTLSGGQISHQQLQMLIILTLASSANTVIIVFNGLLERLRLGVYYLASAVTLLGLTFGLFFFARFTPVDAFLWARLISWVIFLIVPLADLYINGYLNWNLRLPLQQLRFTFNNFLIRAFYTLTFQWDSLLVSFASGAYVTGYFRTVALVANGPLILATFINTKLLPEYSQMVHQGQWKQVAANYRKFLIGAIAVGVAAVLVSIPLANWGLGVLFSREIADAGSGYFLLLFISSWLYVAAVPPLTLLQAMTRDGFLVLISAVQAGVFVVTSTLLYPMFGLPVVPVLLIGVNAVFAIGLAAYAHYCLSRALAAGSANFTK